MRNNLLLQLLQTVSFLTYLLKSCADYIRPHEESICRSIVNLLVTCSDSVSIRKVKDIENPVLWSFEYVAYLKWYLNMLDAGIVSSVETCPWDRFQEGLISFDRHSTGREVVFLINELVKTFCEVNYHRAFVFFSWHMLFLETWQCLPRHTFLTSSIA